MPTQSKNEPWTVTAFGKISEYLLEQAPNHEGTLKMKEAGLTGHHPSEFKVFNGTEFTLGPLLATALISREMNARAIDVFRKRATTCIRSDLREKHLKKAITILCGEDQFIESERTVWHPEDGAVHVCVLDEKASHSVWQDRFIDNFSTSDPLIFLTETSGQHEEHIPEAPYDIMQIAPIDADILTIALSYAFSDEPVSSIETAVSRALKDQVAERLSTWDLILACRAPTPSAAAEYMIDRSQAAQRKPGVKRTDKPIERAVVPLAELVGYGDAKTAALDIVAALKCHGHGEITWSDVPRGLLMIGAPGTGKTELARALSNEAGIAFVAASFSEWQRNGHLGNFLHAMKTSFEEAQNQAPCVLFIDELDSFCEDAPGGNNASYDVKAVKGLLELLDGVRGRDGVVVIAAANDIHKIPLALKRAGRFDTIQHIPLPDLPTLRVILQQHLKPAEDGIDIAACAATALGQTGADCAAAIRKGRAVARRELRPLTTDDVLYALGGGLHDMSDELKFRVAVHECGHALLAQSYSDLSVDFLRISATGGECCVKGQDAVHTPSSLHRDRVILFGGRLAEQIVIGEVSSGSGGDPSSDLARIVKSAANEAGSYGLGQQGALWLGESNSEALLQKVLEGQLPEVSTLISKAETDALARLKPQRDKLREMATALVETGVLTGDRLARFVDIRDPGLEYQ